MAEEEQKYNLSYTRYEVDEAVGRVKNPDTTPTSGHTAKLVTSAGVAAKIEELNTNVSTQLAQIGLKLGDLRRKVGDDMQTVNADLDIADEDGNTLVRFENGHIRTLYFDSSKTTFYVDFTVSGTTATTEILFSNASAAYKRNMNIVGRAKIEGTDYIFIPTNISNSTIVFKCVSDDNAAIIEWNNNGALYSDDYGVDGQEINDGTITLEKLAFPISELRDESDNDLVITDPNGRNLAKFGEGHFKVKNFSTKVETQSAVYENSKIGCVPYQGIEKGAINHIVEYGQSLSVGGASVAITTSAMGSNCKMLGNSVWNINSTTMNPLRNGESESSGESGDSEAASTGEDLIVPFTNVFGKMYGDEYEFLATSSGVSGTPIDWLSKQSSAGYSYYSTRFLQHIANAKNAAVAQGKSIVCPAIVFVQGESDYNSAKASSVWADGANTAARIALYKERLVALKNDMQADIMNLYGQSKKPLFFVHMVGTGNQKKTGMPINMAMFEAAAENEDIILLGSPTFAPRDGIHLSGNGYRWTGEKYAEIAYTALHDGIRLEPVRPRKILIDGYNVVLFMQAPYLPLNVNTWTCQSTDNYGFSVRINGSQSSASSGEDVTINAVKVHGNRIEIATGTNLDKVSNIEVRYTWNDNSSGNICDSDKWCSLYSYADDSTDTYTVSGNINYRPLDENGNNIFGKRYPMMNWCVPFTYYLWNGTKIINIK